jgi:cytochrome bd-type quinol oxidase subunit 2
MALGRFILLTLLGVVFYGLITTIDRLADTEELFPNTDGKLVAAIFLIVMGVITTSVARSKGRESPGWFVCGTLFGPIPLLLASMLPSKSPDSLRGLKKCQNCGEFLEAHETRCFCGTAVDRTSARR